MSKYDPTTNPGDMRTRARYVGIRTPNGATPSVEVLEEQIALAGGQELTVGQAGGIRVAIDETELARVIELRNPLDDSLTGHSLTVAEIHAGVYSFVRAHQELRDAAEAANDG